MEQHNQKKEHVYIGREEGENILGYVDFPKTNIINQCPGFNIDLFTNGITLSL